MNPWQQHAANKFKLSYYTFHVGKQKKLYPLRFVWSKNLKFAKVKIIYYIRILWRKFTKTEVLLKELKKERNMKMHSTSEITAINNKRTM